jgi:hypothetical protein
MRIALLITAFLAIASAGQSQVSFEDLALELDRNGLSREWAAVAALETGRCLCLGIARHNNLFGMRMPAVRPTTAIGPGPGRHAKFRSWRDSVRDLRYWSDMYPALEHESFEQWLRRRGWNTARPGYFIELRRLLSGPRVVVY